MLKKKIDRGEIFEYGIPGAGIPERSNGGADAPQDDDAALEYCSATSDSDTEYSSEDE